MSSICVSSVLQRFKNWSLIFGTVEMGSFDPFLAAFTPMELLGSPNDTVCTKNFDQLSFATAITSSFLNVVSSFSMRSRSLLFNNADYA